MMHRKTPAVLVRILLSQLFGFTLLCFLILPGCAGRHQQVEVSVKEDSRPVIMQESVATFVDNLKPSNQSLNSWNEMAPTVRKSLEYVKKKPQNGVAFERQGADVTWGEMEKTLKRLLTILPALDREPGLFEENFYWLPLDGGIKYTGYFEPVLRASRVKKPGFTHPVYRRPPELSREIARHGSYYSRAQIYRNALSGRGLEIAWVDDPVGAFFLEIQGSGRLHFEDGTELSVGYSGQNRHKYKAIGRLMYEKGLLANPNMIEIKKWFNEHPERVYEVLSWNPSYVFFRESAGPRGAMNAHVDGWRSLAVDRKYIPLGSVVAFGMNMKDVGGKTTPMRGIGFAQDVGGAIKRNRIDLFCGDSSRGEYVASKLDTAGPAWVLVAK